MQNILNRKYDLSINYFGSYEWGDGYGTSNMHWIKYLDRSGVKIIPYFTIEYVERYSVEGDFEEQTILNRPFEIQKIGIIETPPEFLDGITTKIKIGSTMTESEEISQKWVNNCNKMDYLILPSNWQKRVFSECGVTTPIKVIPFGTETEIFKYFDRPKRDVFTFGSVGHMMPTVYWKDRKNFWMMIRAFVSEFDKDEPVRLLIKSTSEESGYYVNWKDPRITVVNDVVTRKKLADYYNQMDCFLFPSRGEGVGQPPREAMLTGLPTILTNYSSLEDIAKEEYCYPLNDYSLVKRRQMIQQPGKWAKLNVRELMYWMRYVYEHQDEARQKGKKASKWIKNNFSWNKSAKVLKEFLKTL